MTQYAETASAKAASAATFGGSALGIFGGINGWLNTLNWNAVATISGILLGLAGFGLNWFYKERHYKLALRAKQANPEE